MDDLVSTQWLADRLGEPGLLILDASYPGVGQARDLDAEFEARHIPGARRLDLTAFRAASDPAAFLEQAGIGDDDRIIVYDDGPVRSATRGWWMLRQAGAASVAVLDGGLGKWQAEGRPLETGPAAARSARFTASAAPDREIDKAAILAGTPLPLLDARDADRFEGRTSDPRPGIADGHIPGARNLPYAALYAADGTMRSNEELAGLFAAAGIDPTQPFVASCGSGITATSLLFAAHRLGNDRTRIYSGSWTEWGADPATPKELGPAAAATG